MSKAAPCLVLLQIQVGVLEDLDKRATKVQREQAGSKVGVQPLVERDLRVEKQLEQRIGFFLGK